MFNRRAATARRAAFFGIFTGLAIIASYLEGLIPLALPFPGVKIGLANVIVLLTLYHMGEKEAFFVSVVRIITVGLLFGGLSGILYSMSGGLLSYLFMLLGKRAKWFGIVGVSVIGGVFHNVGQIAMASMVTQTPLLLTTYLPILILAGEGAGLLTGFAAAYTIRHLNKSDY